MSARIDGNLWQYNLARVVVVDVTEDYRQMRSPMPAEYYPILTEVWVPRICMPQKLADASLLDNYLYDWHQSPEDASGIWYVGVVERQMLSMPF